MTEKLWTVEEAATKMGMHKMTLYNQIRKGQFVGAINTEPDPSVRPKWRIPESALQQGQVIREHKTTAKAQTQGWVNPDSVHRREIVRHILDSFRDRKGNLADEHRSCVLLSPALTYGPTKAYLGANGRSQGYVVEVDEFGETIDTYACEKPEAFAVAWRASAEAWKHEAIKWRQKIAQYGPELLTILGENHPISRAIVADLEELNVAHSLHQRVESVIIEIVKC